MKLPIGKIIHGDCEKILPRFSTNKVKLIVTDPPYQFTNKSKKLASMKKRSKEDGVGDFFAQADNRRSLEKIESTFGFNFNPEQFLKEIFRVCVPFNAYIFTNKNLLETYLRFARKNSLLYEILMWHRTNAIPINHGHYLIDKDYCILLRKKGSTFHSNLGYKNYSTIFTTPFFKKATSHPTEKPLAFIKKIIRISSNPDDIILDPFAGSGTTLVAAEHLERKWIGIEINKIYHKMAERRIDYEKRNPGFRMLK